MANSWYQIAQWRRESNLKFGPLAQLPILPNWNSAFYKYLHSTSSILDVGAGATKPAKNLLNSPNQTYFSLDVDTNGDFDFASFDDIPQEQKFDLIISNQVIEHVPLETSLSMVQAGYEHLKLNGFFIATVPNASHPVRSYADITHITHWQAYDFYGLFASANYNIIELARYNKYRLTINPIKRYIIKVISESFRIDWCDSILIVAQKSSE